MKKRYDSKFKSKVPVEAIKGERSIAEIASYFGVHPILVGQWKKKASTSSIFNAKPNGIE